MTLTNIIVRQNVSVIHIFLKFSEEATQECLSVCAVWLPLCVAISDDANNDNWFLVDGMVFPKTSIKYLQSIPTWYHDYLCYSSGNLFSKLSYTCATETQLTNQVFVAIELKGIYTQKYKCIKIYIFFFTKSGLLMWLVSWCGSSPDVVKVLLWTSNFEVFPVKYVWFLRVKT